MARFIKPIPTLTGAAAERFARIMKENEKNRGCDYNPEVEAWVTEILKRSGMYEL